VTPKLPIYDVLDEVKDILQVQNTLILQAPPGAGKSTILPLALLKEDWIQNKKIILLEPRRLAARSVAQRMAELLGEKVGKTVGYRVRFDHNVSKETKIEVVTEGILTRMIQQDNALEEIGLIIFDEFHERSLNADLALALSREVQQVLRDDLKLLIMSATLDLGNLSSLLNLAPIIESKGRAFPITHIHVTEDRFTSLTSNISKVINKALKEQQGDILVFLPGVGEIKKCESFFQGNTLVNIVPLHGNLPLVKQREAILPLPNGKRKVVLATSIAETSLTIEGIKTVIDCGYARIPRFDPRSGFTKLDTVRITKDTADQRAGRAGRTSPGVCYKMWPKGIQLEAHRTPEILEADLCSTVLELANWGVKDINSLTWLTKPPTGAVAQSLDILQQLKAIKNTNITSKGKQMLRFPTHPRIAHLLLEAKKLNLLSLAIDTVAILEERDPLPSSVGSDINLRIEALRRFRAEKSRSGPFQKIEVVAKSWYKIFSSTAQISPVVPTETGSLLSIAYPERVAKRKNGLQYQLANNRTAALGSTDNLGTEDWLAIGAMTIGKSDGTIFLSSPVDPNTIESTTHHIQKWDTLKGEVVTQIEQRIGNILLSTEPSPTYNTEDAIETICLAIQTEKNKLLPFSIEVNNWQARVMSLRLWNKEDNWPDVSTDFLLQTVRTWLSPYLINIRKKKEIQKLNILTILHNSLPYELSAKLDLLAPHRIEVPSGSSIKLEYLESGAAPILAVRLQEVFGLLKTPMINKNKTPVLLHLLSPGFKPVQITKDLNSFWENTYMEVKKELKRRYPKHSWPEDPLTALAIKGTKKRITKK